MIDVENDVYDIVAKALRTEHSGIFVTGDSIPIDAKLPAVSIVESVIVSRHVIAQQILKIL